MPISQELSEQISELSDYTIQRFDQFVSRIGEDERYLANGTTYPSWLAEQGIPWGTGTDEYYSLPPEIQLRLSVLYIKKNEDAAIKQGGGWSG